MSVNRSEVLVKSQFVHVVRDGTKAVIWHSLFGTPKVVSEDTLRLLDLFSSPYSLSAILDEYEIEEDGEEVIQNLITSRYLVPHHFNERDFLTKRMQEREKFIVNGSLIDKLGLVMTEECNFRCKYCLHFGNLKSSDRITNPKRFMAFEVAKEAIDKYLAILRRHGKNVAGINFGGGEPLLAWPVIERVFEYCRLNYGAKFTFQFSINTNASLITPRIAKKLNEQHVMVASSLDGLQDGNDQVRITKSGQGTFKAIIRGFDNLREQGCSQAEVAVTVNEQNFPMLDERIIDWAISRRMTHLRVNPDVINMVEIPVEDIVAKLMCILRYAKKRGVDVTGSWSRPAGNLNDSILDTPTAFCKALCGDSLCVSPSGNIYGCVYSSTQLGTLNQIDSFCNFQSQYYRFVCSHFTGTVKMCRGCIIEGQCGGGCEITQEFARMAKTAKVERTCALYRKMTCKLLLEQLREINSEVPLEKSKLGEEVIA